MHYKSLILFLLLPFYGYSQNYTLENEASLLEFFTENGKRLVVSKDVEGKYLVCRFGTINKLEFEYPKGQADAWDQFLFSYYSRGGGIDNEAMELNFLYFDYNDSKYVVYEIFTARNNSSEYGLKVIDLESEHTKNHKAKKNTVKGSLGSLRDNERIGKGDELF